MFLPRIGPVILQRAFYDQHEVFRRLHVRKDRRLDDARMAPRSTDRRRGYCIQCYCLTVRMWCILQRIGVTLIGCAGFLLLASSTITCGACCIRHLRGHRLVSHRKHGPRSAGVRRLLVDQFPAAGELLAYNPKSVIDWHLGAGALVLIIGVQPLASLLTKALARSAARGDAADQYHNHEGSSASVVVCSRQRCPVTMRWLRRVSAETYHSGLVHRQ